MRTTTTFVMPALVAGALLVAGCSDTASDGTTTTSQPEAAATFNDADVMFTQMMYPHHAQAVDMAEMVEGRTTDPDVDALAAAIEGAQQPEMDQMTALLASWGKDAPSGDISGMDHGHTAEDSTDGMMTDEKMSRLETLTGTEFDREWLTMMIAHHTGAIEMAESELADGTNPEAKALASAIISAQQTEIAEMQGLLAQ